MAPPKKYLTPAEVAEWMMVSPITVRQWADKGWLPALTTAGGHRRFAREDVEKLANERGLQTVKGDEPLRILIVDDDVQLAEFLQELLTTTDSSIEIDIAHDGFSAGQKVRTLRPHVVLLDLMMPGMDGFQACTSLKQSSDTKDIRVIAMTGFPSPDNVERICAAGAEACFAKPLNSKELLALIGI